MSGERIVSLDDSEEFEADDDMKYQANKSMNVMVNQPITLNVGGMRYTTTKATLSTIDGTFLYTMLIERKFLAEPSKDGSYFIDRDGQHFRYILNFLRDGYVNIGNESIVTELLQEAMFYQIQPMIKFLNGILNKKQIESIESSILSNCHIHQICERSGTTNWALHHQYDDKYSFWEELERIVSKEQGILYAFLVIRMNGDFIDAKMIAFNFKGYPSMVFGIFCGGRKSFVFQNGLHDRVNIGFIELMCFGHASYYVPDGYGGRNPVPQIKAHTTKAFRLNAITEQKEAENNVFVIEYNRGRLLCSDNLSGDAECVEIDQFEIFVCL